MGWVVSRAVVLIRLTRFRGKRRLGRNLITVFQGVNTLVQLFFGGRPCGTATANAEDIGIAQAPDGANAPHGHVPEKKHR
jgi:hypothetical protein